MPSCCHFLVWSVFFVQWHINLRGLFNAETILVDKRLWYYLTHNLRDKAFHNLLNVICSKVYVMEQLGFEPAYYDVTVKDVSHNTSRTSPFRFIFVMFLFDTQNSLSLHWSCNLVWSLECYSYIAHPSPGLQLV